MKFSRFEFEVELEFKDVPEMVQFHASLMVWSKNTNTPYEWEYMTHVGSRKIIKYKFRTIEDLTFFKLTWEYQLTTPR